MATSLTQKLQLKSGQRMVVLNAPTGYVDQLSSALDGVDLTADENVEHDAVLLFVNSLAEAEERVPDAIRAIKSDGLVWVAYPKGASKIKTDVNRDRLWQAVEPMGWRPVRQIALDEVWSAMRFRPAEHVGR